MRRVIQVATTCLLAALAILAVQVSAQEVNTNDRTFMTFSNTVELPGVTLEPGTYEFRLADTDSRNVVQVLRKESREPLGQWTFVQAQRERVSDDTVVMFRENREGATPAVQYWYFPGEKIGKEFIYPKDQAEKIAARTGQTVQSEDGPITPSANARAGDADASAPAAASAESVNRDAPAASQPTAAAGSTTGNRGITPSEEPRAEAAIPEPEPAVEARAESRQVEPAPRPVGTSGSAAAEQQPAPAAEPARELPDTASPLPLAGLIGLLSLAGAAALRVFRS